MTEAPAPPPLRFTLEDQHWFAAISGDANPLHVDPAFAARTFPGHPVVHGLHLTIAALDRYACQSGANAPSGVSANFVRPVIVGDSVDLDHATAGSIRLRVAGRLMATIKLKAGRRPDAWEDTSAPRPPSTPPVDRRNGDGLGHASGVLALPAGAERLREAFPHAAALLGETTLLGLAGISTLIGMESPGLHGILSEFSAHFDETAVAPGLGFRFRTQSYRPAMNRVELAFDGHGVIGTVAALAGRPDALDDTAAIATDVMTGEFAGTRPLIIGASSGLGKATALLLAAGGARPLLTTSREVRALDATVAAIRAAGGDCDTIRLDVTAPETLAQALAAAEWNDGAAYYFATPRIFRRRLEPFQDGDFADFTRFYVSGFHHLVQALMARRGGQSLSVLYPSSSAIDENLPELLEYTLAKLAGERLCDAIVAREAGIAILRPRFARIATRQTDTALAVAADDAGAVMLPVIRRIQAGLIAQPLLAAEDT